MAHIFQLWAECKNEESTKRFVDYFRGLEHKLLTGRTIRWTVEVTEPPSYTPAVVVWSTDLSRYGVRTLQDALEATEAGLRLYHHLKTAPEFRFARVAWEADCLPMADLPEFVEVTTNDGCRLSLKCVVDDELYTHLGSPKFYDEFRPGYWWNRYKGESYRPLYSNDQQELNELCRQLLPEYFSY